MRVGWKMRRVETEMDELEKNYDNNKILFLLLSKNTRDMKSRFQRNIQELVTTLFKALLAA